MNTFTCEKCGSHKLAYKKFVKCIVPVERHGNGRLEYLSSVIDEDDYLATENGFICQDCETFIGHCGSWMENEQDLVALLNMDPELRRQQQKEYDDYVSASAEEQDTGYFFEFLEDEADVPEQESVSAQNSSTEEDTTISEL
ncbi:MAG: hypothetical protein ACYSR0_11435 [Planctomycetota bacterium]|jgi:hypothetical protein